MSEVATQEPVETKEQPPGKVELEDILSEAPVVTPKPEAKKVEEKPAEPAEGDEPTEEPDKEVKPSEEPDTKVAPAAEPPELTEEQKSWKTAYENREKWQKTLTQKSQIASKYSDEELQTIQAELKLRTDLEKIQPTPLPEFIEEEYTDDLGEKVVRKFSSSEIQKIVDAKVAEARNAWVKEKATDFAKGEQAVQEAERLRNDAEANTVITGISTYFKEFPEAAFDLGNDPVQTIKDIGEAGTLHPEYDKFLNLIAVSERAKLKGITMDKAHTELFGKTSQEKKAKDKIKEEQLRAQEEKPGQSSKALTADEAFERSLGIGVDRQKTVFD